MVLCSNSIKPKLVNIWLFIEDRVSNQRYLDLAGGHFEGPQDGPARLDFQQLVRQAHLCAISKETPARERKVLVKGTCSA